MSPDAKILSTHSPSYISRFKFGAKGSAANEASNTSEGMQPSIGWRTVTDIYRGDSMSRGSKSENSMA